MYPSLLRDREYPVALLSVRSRMCQSELSDLCYGMGVIADVTIETEHGEYPLRRPKRTEYPIGVFRTTLAGPDLMAVLRDSKIHQVHSACVYKMGRPFRDAMQKLLDERARCANGIDPDGEAFAKLVANSLAGKLAQHQGKWCRRSRLDQPGKWGESHILNAQTGKITRIQHKCGAAFAWEPDEFGKGPHTSAFAYLTAYGRQMMRRFRIHMPEKSVIAQCTDSLWALPNGVDALIAKGFLSHSGPGYLRIDKHARDWQFYSARHYCVDGKWTLSGYHLASKPDKDGRIEWTSQTPLMYMNHLRAPSTVVTTLHVGTIPYDIDNGRVGDDGWVIPPRYLPPPKRAD